jgi:hypothetical protein
MNFIYLPVLILSYLFMEFNNRYKINLYKINKYYNKINYKLTIITTIYDFSYENIIIFTIYLFLNQVIYFIFIFKLLFMIYCIYENNNKKNLIYNITDFIIVSSAVFVSEFSIMYVIASILLIFSDVKIY